MKKIFTPGQNDEDQIIQDTLPRRIDFLKMCIENKFYIDLVLSPSRSMLRADYVVIEATDQHIKVMEDIISKLEDILGKSRIKRA